MSPRLNPSPPVFEDTPEGLLKTAEGLRQRINDDMAKAVAGFARDIARTNGMPTDEGDDA